MEKIINNMIKCKTCGDVIVSEYNHDMKFCKCGKVAVDGGKSYLRRTYENSPDDLTNDELILQKGKKVFLKVKFE